MPASESRSPAAPDERPQRHREWSGTLRSVVLPLAVLGLVAAVVAWASGVPIPGPFGSKGRALEAGTSAPEFALSTLDGGEVSLQQLRGRRVILNFWASWCDPCRQEMPLLDSIVRSDPDAAVIGVNVREDPGTVQSFIDDYGIGFPIALDPDGSVYRRFRLVGLPATFFLAPDGTIERAIRGPLDETDLRSR